MNQRPFRTNCVEVGRPASVIPPAAQTAIFKTWARKADERALQNGPRGEPAAEPHGDGEGGDERRRWYHVDQHSVCAAQRERDRDGDEDEFHEEAGE
jgi:hypothetical protein